MVVGTLTATDPDKNQILTYAMNAGTVAVPFEIDSNTGEIRVVSSLDFERMSEYYLSATVTDSTTSHGQSDIGYFQIRLLDVNEPPTIESNQKRTVAENSPPGTAVGIEIVATDSDHGGSLSFIISQGNGLGIFTMRSCDGQISIQNSKLLDYETLATKTDIPLTVRVSDGEFYAGKSTTGGVVCRRIFFCSARCHTQQHIFFSSYSLLHVACPDISSSI